MLVHCYAEADGRRSTSTCATRSQLRQDLAGGASDGIEFASSDRATSRRTRRRADLRVRRRPGQARLERDARGRRTPPCWTRSRRSRDPQPLSRPGRTALLRGALAERYDVAPERITLGNGSCDILLGAAQALLEPGAEIVYAWPSFSMYPHLAAMTGARAITVPLDRRRRATTSTRCCARSPPPRGSSSSATRTTRRRPRCRSTAIDDVRRRGARATSR